MLKIIPSANSLGRISCSDEEYEKFWNYLQLIGVPFRSKEYNHKFNYRANIGWAVHDQEVIYAVHEFNRLFYGQAKEIS
jgi:hypothetical protein